MTIDWDEIIGQLASYAEYAGISWPTDDTEMPDIHNGLEWYDAEVPVHRKCTRASFSMVLDMLWCQSVRAGRPNPGVVEIENRDIDTICAAYARHAMTDDWYTCEAGNFISAVLESLEVGI